jgi:hypothetical protein
MPKQIPTTMNLNLEELNRVSARLSVLLKVKELQSAISFGKIIENPRPALSMKCGGKPIGHI